MLEVSALLDTPLHTQDLQLRGYCGWAAAGLQAKVHAADQGSPILWDHLQDCSNDLLLDLCSVS